VGDKKKTAARSLMLRRDLDIKFTQDLSVCAEMTILLGLPDMEGGPGPETKLPWADWVYQPPVGDSLVWRNLGQHRWP
jgi:hypothetical protein